MKPKQIDKNPLNESYSKAPSNSVVKEENNAGTKDATAHPKLKAATPKINVLNVGKVLDQDINTETVNLDTKLVALFLLAKEISTFKKTPPSTIIFKCDECGYEASSETV